MVIGSALMLLCSFADAGPLAPAEAAVTAGQLAQAKALLEPAPASALRSALLARVYHGLQMPAPAREAARLAERTGAAAPDVQHHLAIYFAQSGQRKLAALWEGRYAASPNADAAAPLRAALLYAEVQDWPPALRFGEMALTRANRPEVRSLLARAYEATGQPARAIDQHKALLQLLPYDEPTHSAYGQALLRMARFNEAAAFLAEARAKFDRSPQIELAYGVALYTQRRFADAGTSFFRVIELAPDVPQPYIFLSRMIDQLPGRVADFRARAEAWLRAEPVNGFAPFVLARAMHAAGAPDAEIKPLLTDAIRRDAKQWEFPFELGQLLERERDFTGAAAAYEQTVALHTQAPEPYYRLARVYDRLGEKVKAAKARAMHQKLLASPKSGMQ